MKYLVCVVDEDEDKTWTIEDYSGDDPVKFFAKKCFYGDASATPGDYSWSLSNKRIRVWVAPMEHVTEADTESVRLVHKRWHVDERAKQIERKERAEYERLKEKYG